MAEEEGLEMGPTVGYPMLRCSSGIVKWFGPVEDQEACHHRLGLTYFIPFFKTISFFFQGDFFRKLCPYQACHPWVCQACHTVGQSNQECKETSESNV